MKPDISLNDIFIPDADLDFSDLEKEFEDMERDLAAGFPWLDDLTELSELSEAIKKGVF